jgi:oligoendopeptidase F
LHFPAVLEDDRVTQATQTQQLTRDQVAIEDTWDLSAIFPTNEAWAAELDAVAGRLATVTAFRGRLGDGVDVVRQALDAVFSLQQSVSKIISYAALGRDEDITNNDANVRYERAINTAVRSGQELAFLQPELLALPAETLRGYIESDELSSYRHMLDDLERNRAHVRSAEVEEVLAQMADVSRTASEAFDALDNADLDYGIVTDDQGRKIELTNGRYGLLQESKNREVRRESFESLMQAYEDHRYTVTSLYGSSVRKDVVEARVRGHATVRQEALFDDNIDESVYDTLLERVGAASGEIERYLNLRKRLLGLDSLYRYDLRVPLSKEPAQHYDYQQAVDMVLGGVSQLGEQYVTDLRNGFNSRWVDVYETKGKQSGAYSSSVYGVRPYILMNWNGTLNDVFTLTHEAGHAMHSFYANQAQPYHLARYPIFLAEIASTVNEVLLNWHLRGLEENQTPERQFALLNRFADGFMGTVINQTMYAEFEQQAHARAEEGTPLTLDVLNGEWSAVLAKYQPGIVIDGKAAIGWARIPHFYRAYYVYKYATGLTSAISLARAVRDEGEAARVRYLEMLAAGGSDYPLNLLSAAGVDLTQAAPFDSALAEFSETVAQMEALVEDVRA